MQGREGPSQQGVCTQLTYLDLGLPLQQRWEVRMQERAETAGWRPAREAWVLSRQHWSRNMGLRCLFGKDASGREREAL